MELALPQNHANRAGPVQQQHSIPTRPVSRREAVECPLEWQRDCHASTRNPSLRLPRPSAGAADALVAIGPAVIALCRRGHDAHSAAGACAPHPRCVTPRIWLHCTIYRAAMTRPILCKLDVQTVAALRAMIDAAADKACVATSYGKWVQNATQPISSAWNCSRSDL